MMDLLIHVNALLLLVDELVNQNQNLEDRNRRLTQNVQRLNQENLNLRDNLRQQHTINANIGVELGEIGQMQRLINDRLSQYLFMDMGWDEHPHFRDNVHYVNLDANLVNTLENGLGYRQNLLVAIYHKYTVPDNDHYNNLIALFGRWRALYPRGSIHCICWHYSSETLTQPGAVFGEFFRELDSFNIYRHINEGSKRAAIRQYWPGFADNILL